MSCLTNERKMKPYNHLTKRIAKKKLGRTWKKIVFGLTLKSGDLVSTCKGYNERIKEIYPCWTNYGLSKGEYICDFDIITESGSCCSLVNCCSSHVETKEEILSYYNLTTFQEYLEKVEQYGWKRKKIDIGLLEGKDVFDSDGQPYFEFAEEYEQRARFPERFVD